MKVRQCYYTCLTFFCFNAVKRQTLPEKVFLMPLMS